MKINAYLSHTIRGSLGMEATKEDMERNCRKAAKLALEIKKKFISKLDLYVPAEHEQFVQKAYNRGYLTEKQILTVDCDIVAEQDLLIILKENGWEGGGIAIEKECADDNEVPVFYVDMQEDREIAWKKLDFILDSLISKKMASGIKYEQRNLVG
jgi:hypothetical protein